MMYSPVRGTGSPYNLVISHMKKNKNSSQKKEKRLAMAHEVENHFRLGHCAGKYAESLANPFSGPADACFPVTPACMSRKCRVFVRSQVGIGTGGAGFACMQPLAGNNGAVTAGNVGTAAAYISTTAYAGATSTGIPGLDPATAGVAGLNHNGDYAIGSFGAQAIQARLVSMGMRVRYASTEQNRGGRVILLEDPEHADYSAGASQAQILGNEKAKEHKVGNDWITLCQTGPVTPNEYDYVPNAYTPALTGTVPNHYMLAVLQSTAGNIFDVEFFWNWEYAGRNARGKTASEADDVGVGVVLGAIKSVNDNQLDTRHPIVQAGMRNPGTGATAQVVSDLVQKYAAKNTSGWITKAAGTVKSGFNKAKPYLQDAVHFGEAALPLLAAFL